MANNRLYVVDTDNKRYACIAKNFATGWQLGNKENFINIIENSFPEDVNTSIIIVTENDDEAYSKYLNNPEYKNVNTENLWDYDWENE